MEQPIVAEARKLPRGSAELSARNAEVVKMLETVDIHDVAKRTGLTTTRIRQIENEVGSGRTRLMVALQDAADAHGKINTPLRELAPPLGLDMHNAVHLVKHSLKRAGFVTFVETKGGNPDQQPFKDLALTKRGLRWKGSAGTAGTVRKLKREAKPVQASTNGRIEKHVEQAIADAALDEAERLQGAYTAKPSHIEKLREQAMPVVPRDSLARLEPDADDIDVQAQVGDHASLITDVRSNGEVLVEDPNRRFRAEPATGIVHEWQPSDRLEAPFTTIQTTDMRDFPLLTKLRGRKAELTAVAKTLEEYGLVEEALSAMDAAEPTNELEAEILRYLEKES